MSSAADVRADLVTACCAVSAGVHAGLAAAHGPAGVASAAGFGAAALVLVAAAVGAARRPGSRIVLLAAAAALAGVLAAYAAATTTGLPLVHPGPEPVCGLGLATKAVEALGLFSAASLLRARAGPRHAPRSGRPTPLLLIALVSVFGALVALAVSGGHSGHVETGGKDPRVEDTKTGMSSGSVITDSGHGPLAWRRDQLAASGFPLPLAASLARDARYDLHALIELVERGCRPDVAARIVAPLDGGTAA